MGLTSDKGAPKKNLALRIEDGRTDGLTDGWTDPLIEMRS